MMNDSDPHPSCASVVDRGTVYLVGGGPGDPGLLTLRAKECLEQADFVLYDQLVSPRVLDFIAPAAERLCVRELPGTHPERWPHIHRMLIEAALLGKRVVRLKGGDPFIFGRGGEETEALREANVRYEIVPGITAALAAGAYLEVPLTHRSCASALAIITGHENPAKGHTHLDWEALAKFPGTLAIYMGIARLPLIAAELIKFGKDPDTPSIIVHKASTGEQLSVQGTLTNLEDRRRENGIDTPALVLIGPAVALRPAISWFEQRPLLRQWVVVTRPQEQGAPMMRRIEQLGGVPFHLPAVEIREPIDWTPVDRAIEQMRNRHYQWLVFTSVNGVKSFFGRLFHLGRDVRDLGGLSLAAIGPATAQALREYHLHADVIPDEYRSEKLVEELRDRVRGQRVLLARADRGRELLHDQLAEVAEVEQVAVYSQIDAIDTKSEIFDHLRRGEINFVTLTSSNIAKAILRSFDETINGRIHRGDIKLVSISPVTSGVIREMGYPVAVEAREYTTEGMIDALVRFAEEQMGTGERQAG